MSEEERTAACLLYLFAALAYPGRVGERGWYEWVTDEALRYQHTDLFTVGVLWAMRYEDDDPDPDWINYAWSSAKKWGALRRAGYGRRP